MFEENEPTENETINEDQNVGETPNENTLEDKEDSSDDSQNDSQDEIEKKPKKNRFKARLDKQKQRAEKARLEAEYWKEKALQRGNEDISSDKNEKPKAEDFESQEEFIDALTDWKLENRMKGHEEKQKQTQVAKEKANIAKSWQKKINDFSSEHPDFDEALEDVSDIEVKPLVHEAIIESDLGPAVLYELAKNPEEAEKISKMSEYAAIKAIGKIEDKLRSGNKKISKAPTPIEPGRGSGKVKKDIYDPNLSQKEYEALRAKQN